MLITFQMWNLVSYQSQDACPVLQYIAVQTWGLFFCVEGLLIVNFVNSLFDDRLVQDEFTIVVLLLFWVTMHKSNGWSLHDSPMRHFHVT